MLAWSSVSFGNNRKEKSDVLRHNLFVLRHRLDVPQSVM